VGGWKKEEKRRPQKRGSASTDASIGGKTSEGPATKKPYLVVKSMMEKPVPRSRVPNTCERENTRGMKNGEGSPFVMIRLPGEKRVSPTFPCERRKVRTRRDS